MEHAEELTSLSGSALASFIGQDDKAHVPIDILAANKQAQLLMSVKYKIQLPDHDFFNSTKCQLTLVVIDLREIKDASLDNRNAVQYARPTLIQIKSLKQAQFNAAVQVEVLYEVKTEELCKLEDRSAKPILILTQDGHDDFLPQETPWLVSLKGKALTSNLAFAILQVQQHIALLRDEGFTWCCAGRVSSAI